MARRSTHSHRTGRRSSTPAERKGIPLSPLAQRMLHDLQLAGLSERTQKSYLHLTTVGEELALGGHGEADGLLLAGIVCWPGG